MKKSNGFGQRYAARQYARRAILAILVAASISGVARAQNSENDDAKSTAQRTEWSLIPELTFKNPFAFGANKEKEQEEKIQCAIDEIKDRYGKNSILKASALLEDSTIMDRNKKIGGHHE